jgi:hypothetical protein
MEEAIVTTHIMSMTYQEKIPAVLEGTCHQTIREEGKTHFRVGEPVFLHGWVDKPYHSPWSWRMKVHLTEVITIIADLDGYRITDGQSIDNLGRHGWHVDNKYAPYIEWSSCMADGLAILDGIVPPTGLELKKVLSRFVDLEQEPILKILRW